MSFGDGIDAQVWLKHAWRNLSHSLVLLLVMGRFLALLGWLLWGGGRGRDVLVVGLFGLLFNPTFPPWLVMRMYGATPISAEQAPAVSHALTRLSESVGLPRLPALYCVPSRLLNAFAVGSPGSRR